MMLFKVLVEGKPCNGGRGEYPPVGVWSETIQPQCCRAGWHLTSDPLRWWRPRATLWLAEGQIPMHGDGSDKAAFSRVRLIEPITKDWEYLIMFPRIRCFLAASARSFDADADIAWAKLTGADLTGADLTGADLAGAKPAGARFQKHTSQTPPPPLSLHDALPISPTPTSRGRN